MRKFNVKIVANKKYIANSLSEAENMARKDIPNIHYLWKTKLVSIRDIGKIGEEE
jgi:hypothetical protein